MKAAETEVEAAAVHSAAAQLKILLSEIQAQQTVLATSYDAWEDRLDNMKTPEDLISALRDIEQELNSLGDGLPRGKLVIHPLSILLNSLHLHCCVPASPQAQATGTSMIRLLPHP